MEKKSESAWKKAPPENEEFFNRVLAGCEGVEKRRMFGYPCAFTGGNMFFGLFSEEFFLRLAEKDRLQILSGGQAVPFEPLPGRVMKEYVSLAGGVVSDESVFQTWFKKSLVYASNLPEKVKKGGKK